MEKILIYALVMVVYGVYSFLKDKNKREDDQAKQRKRAQMAAQAAQQDDAQPVSQESPLPEKKSKRKVSLADEALSQVLFEEGSARSQHSSQYEAAPVRSMTDHTEHPLYDKPAATESTFEMDAEKMRQALIYQTILERPQY